MQNIMIVCIGNICRSPVAEGILKKLLPEKTIFSSGLGALVGHGAEPTAKCLALKDGIDISKHKAQQINSFLCKKADLILVMEKFQREEIETLYPFTKGKVHLLGRLNNKEYENISDPYKKSVTDFTEAHKKIKLGTTEWAKIIKKI